MTQKLRHIFTVILVALCFNLTAGDDLPSRPMPAVFVNDMAEVMTNSQKQALERRLEQLMDSTTVQLVVITTPDLGDYDISDYAIELGVKWGVGAKGEDNGIVMVIKPKTAQSGEKAFISVGYGLEEVITDAASKMIVERELIPYFKANDYYGGIDAGVTVLIDLAEKKYSAGEYESGDTPLESVIALLIFFFPLIAVILLIIFSKKIKKSRGSWDDFSSGSGPFSGGSYGGGFGGFSGGGFSGGGGRSFGGGSFGGGGAGGSW